MLFQVTRFYQKNLEMSQVTSFFLFILKSLLCTLCGGSCWSLHTLHSPASHLSSYFVCSCCCCCWAHSCSSLTSNLFEEALVEEMRATGKSLILQTEEEVPEIDASDALPCGSGSRRTSSDGWRGTCSWSLWGGGGWGVEGQEWVESAQFNMN